MRVPEGIPKGFRGNPVDLVTNDRVQISRLALDCDTECGRPVGARVGRELVAKGPDRHREIVAFDGRRAQALHRVPAFGDRLCRMFNRAIQFLFRVCRALRQQVRHGLESQQQTVEALEQRVVQFAGDSCALADARLERHVERVLYLTHPERICRPQQRQQQAHSQAANRRGPPPRRRDHNRQRYSCFIPHAVAV